MKTINDQFRALGLYCSESLFNEIEEYVEYYDRELIVQNIEVFMDANRRVMNIKENDYKKVGQLWKLAYDVYLSRMLDSCRENAKEGHLTELIELTPQKAYEAALKSRKNLRDQLKHNENKKI